jgi:outer membrane protein assembly factor BamB
VSPRPRSAPAILAALTLAVAWVATTAADWPTYLANGQRNGANAGETILTTANASQLVSKWTYKTGGVIAASPTVVAGVVYVGSWDGYEYALDAGTGALKWRTFLGITTGQSGCSPQSLGISSAAAVTGGVVYVGGGDSYWYALDAATGNVLWRVFTGDNSAASGHYNWASPLLYNGYAYVGVSSLGDCPLVQGQLLQVSLSTHQIVNTVNVVPNGQVGGGIWTSPAVDPVSNTIFVTTGTITNYATEPLAQAILAIDATSLTLKDSWQLPSNVQVQDSDWGTTPTLFTDASGNLLVAAINKNGFAYALKRTNLAAGPVWQQQVAVGGICPTCGDGSVSSGAFANGTLFLAAGNTTINGTGYPGSVRAFDPATGSIRWQHGAPKPVVPALAYANGLVIDGAGPNLEVLDAADGTVLFSYKTGGGLYAAPSVSNGMIFTGGTDGNVDAFGLGTAAPPPTDPNCPSGWVCQDVGSPLPAGSESVSGNTWTVQAGGAGVGGSSDAFRLMSESFSGDTQVTGQVTSIGAAAPGSQAGLMIRQSSDPSSPYYAILQTAANGLTVQSRNAFSGATTVANTLGASSTPVWLEIQRIGNQFSAATSTDGSSYTLVPGTTVTVPMPALVLAGSAVSSAVGGTPVSATITSPTVGLPGVPPSPTPSASACPAPFTCADVGNPLLVGDQSLAAGSWTISGAGTDIGSYADQFHFVWQPITGNGAISARVATQANTSGAAKAGVMLRQSSNAGAAYYGAFLTPANGIVVQNRTAQGLQTDAVTSLAGAAPAYIQVARSGNTFTTYTSPDGTSWNVVAGSSLVLSASPTMLAGMAVTSAAPTTMGNATIDTVTLATSAPPPPVPCVSGWSCADIGNPAIAGSQSLSNGTWTVSGSGGDIWGTADQFRYVWQSLSGSGSVIAHVTAQTNTDNWAKAGVMLRASTDAGSPTYAVFITPGNGISVQRRTAQGASMQKLTNPPGAVPAWLEAVFNGNAFIAYSSADGTTWSLIPGSSTTMSIGTTLLAGMAVTSHNNCCLSTATMDSVSVSPTLPPPPPPPPCPTAYSCADIGNPTPAGSQTTSGTTWTIQGGGADIWGNADSFHYISQSLAGTGSISAHIASVTNSSGWAKAGVMVRQSSDPGSAYYAAFVTPSNGITVQVRTVQGGTTTKLANPAGPAPAWLLVANNAGTYTAYTSTDGSTWNPIAGSQVTLSLTSPLLAGVAVTSHNTGTLTTVVADTVTLSSAVPAPPPPPPPPACPTAYTCADIGNPTPAGTQTLNGTTWTVQGGGGDIWGTSDAFHYISQTHSGTGSVSAHIASQTNSNGWAKAGVMLRQTSDPGAAYFAVMVSPTNGITVQVRTAQGGTTTKLANPAGAAPTWLLAADNAGTFTAYTSTDGSTWNAIAGSTVTLTMTSPMLAGVAVTSHNTGALSTVVADTVTVSNTVPAPAPPPPPPSCPTGWNCGDVGNPALGGSQSLNTTTNTWTIQGAGGDIYNAADQFHFVWQSLAADGSVSAHVLTQTNTSAWAKAGVMLRLSSDPGAPYYAVFITPGNGVTVQVRATQGGTTNKVATATGTVPIYLKITRTGSSFGAFTSGDGATWTLIPNSTVTVASLTGSLLEGLAVTSHNAGALCTVQIDTVVTS